jgi:hypothetical protein
MHAGILPNGKVVFLDKVENYTQLTLPNGQFAYSSEYDLSLNKVLPLAYGTNSFCAGGMPLADGRFLAVGGNAPLSGDDPTVGDGFTGIRYLRRSATNASLDGQDWIEPGNKLSSARWYPSAQILGDGRVFVASGSLNGLAPNVAANNNPTWEMLDRNGVSAGVSIPMDILVNNQPYYMYPFIHLLKDGSLFVFTAKSSILFNPDSNSTLRTFPDLAGDFRTYPNTGGSVMLPLSSANNYNPDIIICGGGPYQALAAPADASCGRIQPLSGAANSGVANGPQWELDSMPEGRVMVEGTLLLDGTVLWMNGAQQGGQGFLEAGNPALRTLIYDPTKPLGSRFTTGASSTIPRLYHSVALLLLDGTILVAGSNPNEQPVLKATAQAPYITDFRVERYTPPNLAGAKAALRPVMVTLNQNATKLLTITPATAAAKRRRSRSNEARVQARAPTTTSTSSAAPTATGAGSSGQNAAASSSFTATFGLPSATVQDVKVVLYYNGFVTHSVHMGHRMIYLDYTGFVQGAQVQNLVVSPPPNYNIAPPGFYMLFIVADGVPSYGQMVQIV